MGKLNLRLACSCLTAAILIVLAILPATRAIVQRQVWIATGAYDVRMGRSDTNYSTTAFADDNQRIVALLSGYNKIPVEARAFELARIAARSKGPEMWAHVIRQTAMAPIQVEGKKSMDAGDKIRRDSLANLEIAAAKEGQRLDPQNAFFYLSEATGLAKLGRWDDTVPVMERGAKATRFDDYTMDEVRRRTERLRTMVREPLASEVGYEWAALVLPHLSNYNQLSRGFGSMPNERNGLRAGLAAAKIGLLLEKTDMYDIAKLVGVGMVKRSVVRLASKEPTSDEYKAYFPAELEKVIAKSHTLGLSEVEEGWKRYRGWAPVQPQLDVPQFDVPEEIPVKGASLLLVIAIIGCMGFCLWLATHLEPSARNIWTLTLSLAALASPLAYVSGGLVGLSYACGSLLLLVGFLLMRLPGKQIQGYWTAGGGLLLILAPSVLISQLDIMVRILGFWSVPFALSFLSRKAAPRWVGVGLSAILLATGFQLTANSISADANGLQSHLPDFALTVLALAIVTIPWLTAIVMSMVKVNLPDALKIVATPLPLFVLITTGMFAYAIREDYRMEKLWKQVASDSLTPTMKKALSGQGLSFTD